MEKDITLYKYATWYASIFVILSVSRTLVTLLRLLNKIEFNVRIIIVYYAHI